jgi:hypothetical protein
MFKSLGSTDATFPTAISMNPRIGGQTLQLSIALPTISDMSEMKCQF